MEQIFSDALGLFGAEIEEDVGNMCHGGLQLKDLKEGSLSGRLIMVDGVPAYAWEDKV